MLIELLLFLIIIHGLIHLLGGLSELRIAEFNNLSGKVVFYISPFFRNLLGVLWLLTCLGFLIAAGALITHQAWAKKFIYGCVLCSQLLIIEWWPDAKFGTVANVLILLTTMFI